MIRHTTRAAAAPLSASLLLLAACAPVKPQAGGHSITTLGGAAAPTTVTTAAPQNPQTPTTTTVEKTTIRETVANPEILNVEPRTSNSELRTQDPEPETRNPELGTRVSVPISDLPTPISARAASRALLRETVTERATTVTGTAQVDTSRDLTARLAHLRGVLWVGLALLIGGPVLGWKLGWFTNGCIAGAVGLLLVILSAVLPGHEAWFGLGGLLLIPLVAYVYYRAHHDATSSQPPAAPPAPAAP